MSDAQLTAYFRQSPWERFLNDTADRLIALGNGDYEACRLFVQDQTFPLDKELLLRIQSKLGQG